MTENDNYIKMVLALPEDFFKDYKWGVGDKFILREDRKHKIHCIGDSILYKFKPYDIQLTSDDIADNLWDAVPLFSQKQLQDIIMKKMNWSPKTLLEMFMFWAQTGIQGDDFWQFDSWDEGWLMFYMFVIDGKKWNGDNWI